MWSRAVAGAARQAYKLALFYAVAGFYIAAAEMAAKCANSKLRMITAPVDAIRRFFRPQRVSPCDNSVRWRIDRRARHHANVKPFVRPQEYPRVIVVRLAVIAADTTGIFRIN